MAASCAFPMRCSMLALESISSDSAIGRLVRLKYVSSCLAPSSKTENSSCAEIGDVAALRIGDRHVERHDLDAGAKDLGLLPGGLSGGRLLLIVRRGRGRGRHCRCPRRQQPNARRSARLIYFAACPRAGPPLASAPGLAPTPRSSRAESTSAALRRRRDAGS